MSSLIDLIDGSRANTALLVLLAVLARVLVGLGGYSGAGHAPALSCRRPSDSYYAS
jgi:hypothetical protein